MFHCLILRRATRLGFNATPDSSSSSCPSCVCGLRRFLRAEPVGVSAGTYCPDRRAIAAPDLQPRDSAAGDLRIAQSTLCSAEPLCMATCSVLSLLISYCGSSLLAWCVYPL